MGDHFTYQWTGPEVAAGTENLFIAEATTYGDYTFTITNTNTGCVNDGLVSVFADTLVSLIQEIVPVGASDDFEITCNPNDIVISAQLILDGSDYDIIWSGPCIDASIDTNPVFNCAGTSTVMYTNNQNGCMASQTVEVTENTTPIQMDAYDVIRGSENPSPKSVDSQFSVEEKVKYIACSMKRILIWIILLNSQCLH